LTELREATEADADRLVAWHADPEVSRYWDDETFARDQIIELLDDETVDAWIVESAGEPVGFIQSWWEPGEPRYGGIDMFIVPSARGRGLGPDAARTFAQSLLAEGWAEVTVDPYLSNQAAIRAWARAGFVAVGARAPDAEHPGPRLKMRFEGTVSEPGPAAG
jgi:aminoglycoside 6'-N-acetyltransferase